MIAPEMPAAVVVALLESFEKSGIEVCLVGGWGVDALLGTQTRVHKDLDVIIGTAHVARIVELLSARGHLVQHGGSLRTASTSAFRRAAFEMLVRRK